MSRGNLDQLKQDQLQRVAQAHVQLCFEYNHRWRLSEQPVPVFDYPHRKQTSKKVFSCFQIEF